ncbi:MAG: hypothetical protein SCH71_12305 [Desulfobulbaceae bacterium]|nr:hypothetical protein [Desulfobulbaceae bacterium]
MYMLEQAGTGAEKARNEVKTAFHAAAEQLSAEEMQPFRGFELDSYK